ncbi:hypothetical protein HQ529_00400 [Candidatus Woesearchaeota archaeon]|nr:hypothetical protein [Candidatus Woesearchaeota archaeon]
MALLDWFNKRIKEMRWYDISLLKLSVFFFTLFLMTVWPAFNSLAMSFEWYWYLALGVLVAVPLCKKMFF